MTDQEKFTYIKSRIAEIQSRTHPPKKKPFLDLIEKTNAVLTSENKERRPYDKSGLPGGIILLKPNTPTIIVPDLHARMEYLTSILFNGEILNRIILAKLAFNRVQIVCVGDGVHSESRTGAVRWAAAFEEYKDGFAEHRNIDEEMRKGFGLMEMVMELKTLFPDNFHFLKGNHENITNEKGNGNIPFKKYSYEGPMVDYYVKKFYGKKISDKYYRFEKNLPVFAIGKNFLVSHAEPAKFFEYERILEYRNNPDVTLGLTWTADGESEKGAVEKMLRAYIPSDYLKESYYFGGHRPVQGLYNSRSYGRFVQIHNPHKFVVAALMKDKKINLNTDIVNIKIEE